jgi:hypothetical protein
MKIEWEKRLNRQVNLKTTFVNSMAKKSHGHFYIIRGSKNVYPSFSTYENSPSSCWAYSRDSDRLMYAWIMASCPPLPFQKVLDTCRYLIFEVLQIYGMPLNELSFETWVCWDMTPCCIVDVYEIPGGTKGYHIRDKFFVLFQDKLFSTTLHLCSPLSVQWWFRPDRSTFGNAPNVVKKPVHKDIRFKFFQLFTLS